MVPAVLAVVGTCVTQTILGDSCVTRCRAPSFRRGKVQQAFCEKQAATVRLQRVLRGGGDQLQSILKRQAPGETTFVAAMYRVGCGS